MKMEAAGRYYGKNQADRCAFPVRLSTYTALYRTNKTLLLTS